MATGVKLCAEKKLPEPVTRDIVEIVPNKVTYLWGWNLECLLILLKGCYWQGFQEGGEGGH